MANITQEINQINTAIYGKDVRSSLANGLIAVNNQVVGLDNNVNNFKSNINNQIDDFENNINGQVNTLSKKATALGTTVSKSVLNINKLEKQIKSTNSNAQNAIKQVNTLLEEANKNGSVGLPLTGGTLTGAVSVEDSNGTTTVDGNSILMNGNQVLFVDSSGNLEVGNSNNGQIECNSVLGANDGICVYNMFSASCSVVCQDSNNSNITSALNAGNISINALTALDGTSVPNTLVVNTKNAFKNGVEIQSGLNITNKTKGVEFDGARVLYLDENNNLWINSTDNMSSGTALGNTYVAGNMELSVSTDNEVGYIINNNNVLTVNGSNLNINQSNGYSSVNVNGVLNTQTINAVGSDIKLTNNKTHGAFQNDGNGNVSIYNDYPATTLQLNKDNQLHYINGAGDGIVLTNLNYKGYTSNATQLFALGKATTNLTLENNQLKTQNKVLGQQVTNLAVQNDTLNKQVKSLAKTIVNMQLKNR